MVSKINNEIEEIIKFCANEIINGDEAIKYNINSKLYESSMISKERIEDILNDKLGFGNYVYYIEKDFSNTGFTFKLKKYKSLYTGRSFIK